MWNWGEVEYFVFIRCQECGEVTCLMSGEEHPCEACSTVDHVVLVDPLGCI